MNSKEEMIKHVKMQLSATIKAYDELHEFVSGLTNLDVGYKDDAGMLACSIEDDAKAILRKHDKEDDRMVANETLCNTQAESEG